MGRILLVEDDDELADFVVAALERRGHDAMRTASGLDGLLAAAREPYDLAIVDIQVPDLSGLGVERALRDLGDVPIVVMSGRLDAWEAEAFASGATACLRKPFAMDDLTGVVDAVAGAPHDDSGWPTDVRRLGREDLDRVARLGDAGRDALPFGAICLDADGVITSFNAYEAGAARRTAADVVGRRFRDLAPCTEVKEFTEAVREGLERKELDTVLRFFFPYGGASTVVSVRLWYDAETSGLWIFVSRRR